MKKKKLRIKWSDILIVFIGIGTIFFVREVFSVFRETGSEPSTLVTGFFSLVTAELAILWRMHNAKKLREMKEKENPEDIEIMELWEDAEG